MPIWVWIVVIILAVVLVLLFVSRKPAKKERTITLKVV